MPIYAGAAGVVGFVRLQLRVYDLDGILADPDDVSVTLTTPAGVATDLSGSVEHPSQGVYHLDYEPAEVGNYGVYWVTTGVNAGTLEEAFNVDDLTISPPLSLTQVKDHLNIGVDQLTDDDEIRHFILAATGLIEGITGPLTRRPATGTFNGGRSSVVLTQYPIVSVTSVTENGSPVTSYSWDADTGIVTKTSGYSEATFTQGHRNVVVTYVAGRSIVPADLQHAVLEAVRHLWETQRGKPTSLRSGDDYVPGAGYSLPNRVKEFLGRYEQAGIA